MGAWDAECDSRNRSCSTEAERLCHILEPVSERCGIENEDWRSRMFQLSTVQRMMEIAGFRIEFVAALSSSNVRSKHFTQDKSASCSESFFWSHYVATVTAISRGQMGGAH